MDNLHELLESTKANFVANFVSEDFVLTQEFKDKYAAYLRDNGQNIEFNETTAIIITSGNLSIYAPNQWFAIASYVVPFLQELYKYKDIAESIFAYKNMSGDDKKAYVRNMKEGPTQEAKDELIQLAEQYFSSKDISLDMKNTYCNFILRFITDYTWWSGSKTIDRSDFYVSPILSLLGLVNASQSYVAEIANNLAVVPNLADEAKKLCADQVFQMNASGVVPINVKIEINRKTGGQNLIVYGAPGTGKSRALEDLLRTGNWEGKQYDSFIGPYKRVVFHPEYTYFDFVGTYKPVPVYKTSVNEYINKITGEKSTNEPYIDYQFVAGPFIDVLVESWLDKANMHTLLIEEINRANAAAVFGEIFQLLDRIKDGTSEYAYIPSNDLYAYLMSIDGMKQYIIDGVRIPSNMNIVATMNSADQGVSSLDSAFKRRWNYKYKHIDIGNAIHKRKVFEYAGKNILWGDFVTALNRKLVKFGVEEDRLIGPYFIKPDELETVGVMDKLLLYLWDDVLRHQRNAFFAKDIRVFSDLSDKFINEDVLALNSYFPMEQVNMSKDENLIEETE